MKINVLLIGLLAFVLFLSFIDELPTQKNWTWYIQSTSVIYNVMGRTIRTWFYENQEKGYHELNWDGIDDSGEVVPSGTYLIWMQAADFSETRRITVMR